MFNCRIIGTKDREMENLKKNSLELTQQRKILAEEVFRLREMLNKSEAQKVNYFHTLVQINRLVL